MDYSKVNKKHLLIKRVLELQKNISDIEESLEREQAIKNEF